MENLRLNDTPLRTSVNFGINDILIKNIEIPKISENFKNYTLENKSKNIKVEFNSSFKEEELVYGIGKEIEKLNKNIKCQITLNEMIERENLRLDFNLTNKESNLSSSIKVEAKENSKGIIFLRYASEDNVKSFSNINLKINACEKSELKIVVVNMLNEVSDSFLSIESNLAKESKLNVVIVDFGGKTSISNYYSNIEGESSISTIDSIYLGDKERLIDINYIAHLSGQKSKVNIEVQGALKDNAKKNFKGTIDFKTGAKKAIGNENEFCMLLSPTAKSKALPMLLCSEDDVEGNHSTASGKVDKAELFYLMSRGISQNEAMKLLVRAKFSNIIDKIDDEEIKKEILNQIDVKLN